MRTLTLAAALVACVIALGACGDDDSDNGTSGSGGGGGGAAATLELAADPNGALKFDKTSLEAKPGEVVIAFDNQSDVPHAVEVEGNGVEEETETITMASEDLSVDLDAGEYVFYCPVGNHRQEGMEGTLTVR